MDEPLPPVPAGMEAQIRHDGVFWELRGPSLEGFGIAVLGAAMAVGVGAVVGGPGVGAGVAAVVVAVAALILIQHPWRVEVQLTDRALCVTRRSVRPVQARIPLERLELADVIALNHEQGRPAAVFRGDRLVVTVGIGEPEDHLRWLVAAVEEARRRHAARTRVEGREYGFMRKPPPELLALGTSRDEPLR